MRKQLLTFTVTIPAPQDFTGRILVKVENGMAKNSRRVDDKEHVASLAAFLELAKMAGFTVTPPAA